MAKREKKSFYKYINVSIVSKLKKKQKFLINFGKTLDKGEIFVYNTRPQTQRAVRKLAGKTP